MAVVLTGCAFPNQFHDQSRSLPHGTVTAVRERGSPLSAPTIFYINDQPTSFWKTRQRYYVAPGPVVLNVIADREPYEFEALPFTVKAGAKYDVRRVVEGDQEYAVVCELPANPGASRILARASRKKE
jgi:hypothetical protein